MSLRQNNLTPVLESPLPENSSRGFCFCGCGERTTISKINASKKEWIKGESIKFINTHHTRKYKDSSFSIDTNGCWVWNGSFAGVGYGEIRINRKRQRAHRYFYEKHIGSIPKGLVLDHLCRNRRCVNPRHLEAVTQRENILRGVGICAINARKTHCKRGHLFDEKNSQWKPNGKRCGRCHADEESARRNKYGFTSS